MNMVMMTDFVYKRIFTQNLLISLNEIYVVYYQEEKLYINHTTSGNWIQKKFITNNQKKKMQLNSVSHKTIQQSLDESYVEYQGTEATKSRTLIDFLSFNRECGLTESPNPYTKGANINSTLNSHNKT